jgi:glycosyltransferase involved in cell wall biosynthesis
VETVEDICSEYSAVVLSIVWPGDNSGGSLAIRSSLIQYARCFKHVYFIGLVDRPLPPKDGNYQNVTFHHVPIQREALWLRFGKSLLSRDPASMIAVKGRHAFGRLCKVFDDALNQAGGKVVSIIECITPCVHLPGLKRRYPEIKWIYRNSDILHRAFSPFASQGNPVVRLAWKWEIARTFRIERWVADTVDFYWTITPDDAAETERIFARTVDGVLGIDVDTTRFDAVEPGDLHTVIHLGTADYRKAHGIRSFLELAWPRLRAAYPDARFLLGGLGTESFNRPNEGIFGLGFIQDPAKFLSEGFIFLNPQRAGTGIKVKSLNAMAAGKLLVTSENGALGIGGKDGEHLLIRETSEALGDAILDAWKNPEIAARIGVNGRRHIETSFSAEGLSKRFDALIVPILKELD